MDTVIFLLIVLASVSFVALPYLRRKAVSQGSSANKNGRLADLYGRRDNLLAAIKEIEFDHAMGKISVEDFAEMNSRYRQEAVKTLKHIDAMNGKHRGAQKLEAELRTARMQPKATTRTFCSACGAAAGVQDRFCSNCGQRLC